MTAWFVIVSVIVAVNPPRVAAALSETPRPARTRQLAAGATIAAAVIVVLGLAADRVLDVLDITDETWRIASGAVAVLSAARHLALPDAAPVPGLTRRVHTVVPVAFPVMLVPELVVLALLYGATESRSLGLVATLGMFGASVTWGTVRDGPANRGAARMLAALLAAAGIALIVAGIRDV